MQDKAQSFDTSTTPPMEHGDDVVLDPSVLKLMSWVPRDLEQDLPRQDEA